MRCLCPARFSSCSLRALAATLALVSMTTTSATAYATPRPRLGVLVVFDQLPSWLLDRGAPFFGDGGFGGVDGARYDAWFDYAGTETAPGHATLATGALPSVHGIATNAWIDRGVKRYAVDDAAFPVLAPTDADADARAAYGRGPARLLVPTLADTMKLDSHGRARVVALSHKDRSAILSAGPTGDLAVWYDPQQGRYTTSTAYRATLPAWLADAGAALPKKAMAEGTWSPLPVPRGREALVPADDRPGEATQKWFGRTFPHDVKDVADDQKKLAYRMSPQAMDDLFALALRAVTEERMGDDDEPDLLVVSVSTTDIVGHAYGGDSLEALDLLRRADASLRRFLAAVNERVGRQNVVVAVTGDHGAPELPASMVAQKMPAAAVHYEVIEAAAEDAANAALSSSATSSSKKNEKAAAPAKKRVQGFFPPQLFIDTDDLDDATADRVTAAVAKAVAAVPGIGHVYDLDKAGDDDEFAPLMRASAPPGRAARLFVRQNPRVVLLDTPGVDAGTDHGTPYAYDRRVPLLLSGPGVRRGRFADRVDARDVSASLAFALGVPPPDACAGRPVSALGAR
jgi:hypothetical protein